MTRNLKFARCAGPYGDWGFSIDAGKFHFAVNAGWYTFSIGWNASWFLMRAAAESDGTNAEYIGRLFGREI